MFAAGTISEIAAVATENGIEPAALLAVAEVESGGRVYATVNGRHEPLIRFEGHYFDRRLNGATREQARAAGLSSPVAGIIANPASQTARWRMLTRAMAIDRKAACESVSWGLGQVMGAHWAWLGFSSVDALVEEARGGAAGQVRLMVRYIVKAGLRDALAGHDWARFARGYNGPNYRKNRYHTRLAAAYRRHVGRNVPISNEAMTAPLRRGSRGTRITDLQVALTAAGYPLQTDGAFGPLTDAALRRFQRDHGLAVDGIAGPDTMQALRKSLSVAARLSSWWSRLKALLRRLHMQRSN